MRFACSIYCALFTLTALSVCVQDSMDRVDEALTFSGFDDQVRARFSGLLDLEAYSFSGAPQGLIFTDQSSLLNPRLTLFFDAQIGSSLYLFVQSRVDRGFDPSDSPIGISLSEYALRWTPREDGLFNLQVGRFSTIVGNYVGRHLSWDNPFINAPMIYGNVTAIYDSEAPPTVADFAAGIVDAKYEYNPVIWGPAYTSGLSVSGTFHKVDYAVEVKTPRFPHDLKTGIRHRRILIIRP